MYKIFSVDDHIVEPPDVWTSRLPAGQRERGPHVVVEGGRQIWEFEDKRVLTPGLNAVAGRPREEWGLEPTSFADMIPGCYDPKERAADLLSQGVLASLGFPTLPRFGGLLFAGFDDKELADLCVRAWNDYVLEEWCPGGPPGLYVPMMICQLWDPELAAAEIRRCAARGTKALAFPENTVPAKLPGFHTPGHWDPVWEAAQEVDMPVCMHIASSGYIPVPDPAAPAANMTSMVLVSGILSMLNIIQSPVCHEYPGLKILFSEAGIGWIPAALERADRQCERQRHWSTTSADLLPSEIFRRNMWACMVEEPIGLSFYEEIGVDRILAETDYPHSDSTYPHVQKSCDEIYAGIPDEVVTAVTHGNAEALFDWTMADESLLTSPDVERWRSGLEHDPHAALARRRELAGVEVRAAEASRDGLCAEYVLRKNDYVRCGRPIGADGACEKGHRP